MDFWIKFALCSLGLTCFVIKSKAFKPVRKLAAKLGEFTGSFITCWQCVGFWSGMVTLVMIHYEDVVLYSWIKIDIFIYAFSACFLTYLINKLIK